MRKLLLLIIVALPVVALAQQYDVVIHGGRVIDPETGLDAVRDVGIRGGQIVAISEQPLSGAKTIQANGLVVAPGFIDLHQHDHTPEGQRLKAFDGVTTALELEIGVNDVKRWLDQHRGSIINYGTTASHPAARANAFGLSLGDNEIVPPSGPATNGPATAEQVKRMQQRLREQLDAGGLGVGMGIQYTPGATRQEIIEMFRVAAERDVPVFVHIRSAGRNEPGSSIESVGEVISAAAVSGAPLHIVHLNSMCMRDAPECLRMIGGARARGLDVTTEAYPYIAGMTQINSALFNPGWREKFSMDYSNLMLPGTGERLTKERFEELHASPKPQTIILFNNTQEAVDAAITDPLVMVASDGVAGHPRNAGTYARFYAQYVREKRSVTLIDAIRKMSYMPAQRLEKCTPAARKKGRLQTGADADIVIFDPQGFRDTATFEKGSVPSVGVKFLLVNGIVTIENGNVVAGASAGRALTGTQQ